MSFVVLSEKVASEGGRDGGSSPKGVCGRVISHQCAGYAGTVLSRTADRQNVTRNVACLGLWFAVMSSDETVTDFRKQKGASQK